MGKIYLTSPCNEDFITVTTRAGGEFLESIKKDAKPSYWIEVSTLVSSKIRILFRIQFFTAVRRRLTGEKQNA